MSIVSLFVHREGASPVRLEIKPDETVAKLLQRLGIDDDDQIGVSITDAGDPDDDLDPEDIDRGATLESLGVRDGHHMYCHCRARVLVKVNFECETFERLFPRRTRIRKVLRRAFRQFNIAGSDQDDLFLRTCHDERPARPNDHLAEYIQRGDCEICFDLLSDVLING